jgi:hypothetical protein
MNRLRAGLFGVFLALVLVGLGRTTAPAAPEISEKITFLVTSDLHYASFRNVDRNDRNRITIERMNTIAGTAWPAQLGGGKIEKPRGVLALGDLIDDGDRKGESATQWRHFEMQFGLDGTVTVARLIENVKHATPAIKVRVALAAECGCRAFTSRRRPTTAAG